jgi:UDP-N-acetylmuramoyl-tripeptide--D-alanyl-D-alanine ligase
MAEALWTTDEICAATGGLLQGASFEATGVSIDSRSLEPGDLFVALRGERDGHAFARDAFARGAAGILASELVDGPHVLVDDTLEALERLGVAARVRTDAKRGAVTGSVGKTSVTQAIKAALELAGPAHGSVKSYNNHFGVPLTLARMPRATRRAVFEIGMNHSGEIVPLSEMVAPHAACITTVGPVHIENFENGEEGVARAKAEIFAGLVPGGIAVLNHDDDKWFELLRGKAKAVCGQVRTFGRRDLSSARLTGFEPHGGGAVVRARLDGKDIDFTIAQSGVHWGLNSLCALLMLQALDVDLETAFEALARFGPLQGRGLESEVALPAGGAFTLIDESYNANPMSMRAAFATLGAHAAKGRRIVVLTDMLELGSDAAERHAALAEPIEAAGAQLVFCAGPLMRSLYEALPASLKGGWAASAAELASEVKAAVRPGDVVMVKGSNGSKAGLLAQALASLGAPAEGPARGAA